MTWPLPTDPQTFDERRQKLQNLFSGCAIFAAGLARPRNFPANRYYYRADSHFLYLVGMPLEGAVLSKGASGWVLYAEPPEPNAELWSVPPPSLVEIEAQLGIEVRPVDEVSIPKDAAVLPPQDVETVHWLQELLGRELDPDHAGKLEGVDRELAKAMITLRLQHDAAALTQLRQAAGATCRAHREGMRTTRPGLREAAVRGAMESTLTALGMGCSYNSIVTARGEILHNHCYEHLLESGDLVLADVGAETPEGWAGDVTRTWPVSGRFSTTQRVIYEAVLAAQEAAIAAVAPGKRFLDIHRLAGKVLLDGLISLGLLRGESDELYAEGAVGVFFPHGIGHLLGLDVHDMEDLGDLAGYAEGRERPQGLGDRFLRLDRDLLPGMVVTIEPGFYRIPALLRSPPERIAAAIDWQELRRFEDVRGIRIEDDVLVTDQGHEVLTRELPKQAEEVEALVGCSEA